MILEICKFCFGWTFFNLFLSEIYIWLSETLIFGIQQTKLKTTTIFERFHWILKIYSLSKKEREKSVNATKLGKILVF